MPPAVRSARISTAELRRLPRLHKLQGFGPRRKHMFFHGPPGRATAPLLSAPIPAEAARRPAYDAGHSFKRWERLLTNGNAARARQQSLADAAPGRENHASRRVADLRQPPPSLVVRGQAHLRAGLPPFHSMSFRSPPQQKSSSCSN